MSPSSKKALITLSVLAVTALVVFAIFLLKQPQPDYLHGEAEVREIRVAAKIPGRVAHVMVQEGQQVQQGDILFELLSPELDAKLAQARAAEAAAVAMQNKAEAGLRTEEIDMARLDWQRALVQEKLAAITLQRMNNLYQEGLLAAQQRDEVQAKWQAAHEQANAAEARYNMAAKGARQEELQAVQAQSRQAAAAVAEAESYRAETQITAPISAEVSAVVIHQGELAPAGFPVVTLADLQDIWVTFNIREDKLQTLQPGARFSAVIPALNKEAEFQVTKLNALPAFASWKQVKGTPGYDLKTFQLEARPVQPVAGLRAGMTVITYTTP